VLLTVLGDVVLPTGGQAWHGALAAVCGQLDISPPSTRQALRRLVTQDIVAPRRHGRRASYVLTPPGRRRLEEAAERIYLRRPLEWDGRWRLLSYSFPEGERSARDALRKELRWLGYGTLSNGLWVCPWDHGARLEDLGPQVDGVQFRPSIAPRPVIDDVAYRAAIARLAGVVGRNTTLVDQPLYRLVDGGELAAYRIGRVFRIKQTASR
jgi:DNA-binding transcriptional regulator PaaX